MPRTFESGPLQITVGAVTLKLGYDATDHSLCKLTVAASGSQAETTVSIPRGGNATQALNLGATSTADKQALAQQASQGGPVGSTNVPRGTITVY